MRTDIALHFDEDTHTYRLDGQPVPSVTQLLKMAGYVDDRFFTPESAVRGQHVHTLTADYDTGAIVDPARVDSPYKGYLLGYAKAVSLLRPRLLKVEEPAFHPAWRFAGRPDRIVTIEGLRGPLEIKSAVPASYHAIQTALQAILEEAESGVPAESQGRWCVYVTATGRCTVDQFENRRDFDAAYQILRTYAGPVGSTYR